MTARQLIRELTCLPPDAEVRAIGGDHEGRHFLLDCRSIALCSEIPDEKRGVNYYLLNLIIEIPLWVNVERGEQC